MQENVLSDNEILQLGQWIDDAPSQNANFRINEQLFAIRNLLGEIPALKAILKNTQLQKLLESHFPKQNYQCIKAIYFDKPPQSNWVVNWHQDLTINVKEKPLPSPTLMEVTHFRNWVQKSGFWSVQPTLEYLQNIVTVRLHLEDCLAENGALKVLRGSHAQGIGSALRLDQLKQKFENVTCEVSKGGALVMSPLLWHASAKNRSSRHRRVIHLEFCSLSLPKELEWYEEHAID